MLTPAGIIPAMITPLTESHEINEHSLRRLVQRLIDSGVHGLFCLGTNGEFFSLTPREKVRVAEIVVDETAGRVPVYAGSGAVSTEETIAMTRRMERIGVDAVSVITPYFLKFTQKEIATHFQHVADCTALPVMLYNIPGFTGNHLLPETVALLAKEPNIVGIKDSSGKFDVILQYLDHVDESFSVLSGTDSLILSTLMAGGKGGIASTANFVPGIVVSIYTNWRKGRIEESEHAQNLLRPIRSAFQLGTLPSVLKAAMNMLNLSAGPPKLPVDELGDEEKRELKKIIEFYTEQGVIDEVV